MNQNTSVDSDLQKAIDDITKSTSSDPLFADPVATPAPVGPFPAASAAPAMPPRAPMPAAPRPPMPPRAPAPKPAPEPMPAPEPTPAPEPMPGPEEVAPAEPVSAPIEDIEPTPITHEDEPEPKTPFMEGNLGIDQVKEAALRELAPIVNKLDIPAEQKFNIYQDVIDNYHESSVIESAYHAASDIKDDQSRAEALLYIIDSIDHM